MKLTLLLACTRSFGLTRFDHTLVLQFEVHAGRRPDVYGSGIRGFGIHQHAGQFSHFRFLYWFDRGNHLDDD